MFRPAEPSNYVCSTCKARLSSAWRLVQHVQHAHNVKIYVEANGDRVSRMPSPASSHNNGSGSRSSSKGNSAAGNGSSHMNGKSDKNSSASSICSTSSSSPSGSLLGAAVANHHQNLANKHMNHQIPPQSLLPLQNHLQQQLQQQLAAQNQPQNQSATNGNGPNLAPPGMRHHPLLPPPDMHNNPFGLLRMPMPPNSVVPGVGPLFPRSHDAQHQFRMEQLMSEQFRHHANLAAAAVAAANMATPQGFTSPVSTGSNSERPPSSGSARNMSQNSNNETTASQMDFYSQRLRQLAGTTSPGGAVTGNSTGSVVAATTAAASPSPRKQQNSSPFPGCSPIQTNPATPIQNSSRPQSLTPPDSKQSSHNMNDLSACNNGTLSGEEKTIISNPAPTPPSASTPPARQGSDGIHSCDFCDKKFRFQSSLIVHRRQHTGEKLFKCTNCEFSCLRAKKLKRHMKLHESPEDQKSNSGSDGDQMHDEDSDKEDDDEDEENEDIEENEDEEEELDDEEEDEMDEDENEEDFDDEAEDLSVSSSKMMRHHRPTSASLVGELMDKFGLSNIAQYSEAYKQALQESGNALKMHLTSKDRDNNNSAPPIMNGMPAALRLREEFQKNLMAQNPNHMPMFNPFENPFDQSAKRMKLDGENGWWGLPGLHRGSSLFEDLKSKVSQGGGNHMMTSPLMKKESRRNDTCEYCGKVFKNCSNLTVHRRSHTGEKPYKCELCSYACAQSSKLTRHMKTHGRMGKDVYKCRFCDMPFSVPSTLEKHMRKCVVNQGRQLNNNNNNGNANHNLANGLAEQLSRSGMLGRHSDEHLAGMPPGMFGGVDMEELMAKQETA